MRTLILLLLLVLVASCTEKHCGVVKSKEMSIVRGGDDYCLICFEDGTIIDTDLHTYMNAKEGQKVCVEGYEK